MRRLPRALVERIGALAIVAFGGWLRFRHLGWASGQYFQPDESVHTIEFVLRLGSSLNPYDVGPYTYGGLPLYLYRLSAQAMSWLAGNPEWLSKWHVTLIARFYAAGASTMTILLLYLVWQRLGEPRLGLIGALAFAVAPLSVQYAHYGAVDTLLTFWIALASLLGLEAWTRGSPIWWLMTGAAIGLAAATKTSGVIWGLLLVVAAGDYGIRQRKWREGATVLGLGLLGGLIGIGFGSPYYILDLPSFLEMMDMQSAKTVTGQALCTYHWQFLNARSFLFELEQLSLWAMGLPLCVVGLAGALWLWGRSAGSSRDIRWLILLVPPTVYFVMIGLWHAKFIRYLLPIVPTVSLCAVEPIRAGLKALPKVGRWGLVVLTVIALLHSGVLAVATSNVYAGQDPRVAASEWMVRHIDPGARILHDPEPMIELPLGVEGGFVIRPLDLYGNGLRNINDPRFYAESLRDQEYIVIVSRRHRDRVFHLRGLFPTAACYYDLLFDASLGYEMAADFSNYPRLGPFVWYTDEAEQTFQVFDHPHVYIFKRERDLGVSRIEADLSRCASP